MVGKAGYGWSVVGVVEVEGAVGFPVGRVVAGVSRSTLSWNASTRGRG